MFSVEEYTEMEAENPSKAVITFYKITWRQITQGSEMPEIRSQPLPYTFLLIHPEEPKRDHNWNSSSVTASIRCHGNVLTEPLPSTGLFRLNSLLYKRVLIP
jgi:hypothetical protein